MYSPGMTPVMDVKFQAGLKSSKSKSNKSSCKKSYSRDSEIISHLAYFRMVFSPFLNLNIVSEKEISLCFFYLSKSDPTQNVLALTIR